MSFPSDVLVVDDTPSPFLYPDNLTHPLTEDYEYGGLGLNDPSQGLRYRVWKAWIEDGTIIWVAPLDDLISKVDVLTGLTNVTEVSLAFDQNMRPFLAFVENGISKLYWYDSFIGGVVTTSFSGAIDPKLSTDDKRSIATETNTNDVILFYIRTKALYWRIQRERFLIEHHVADLPFGENKLLKIGMDRENRFQARVRNQVLV